MADGPDRDGSSSGTGEREDGTGRRRDGRRVLLIGQGQLPDATARALQAGGASVDRLLEPSDRDVHEALGDEIHSVVVISRYDVVALRYALVVEHLRPGIPLVVTSFGRGAAEHLEGAVENVRVLSMADIVAPSFVGPCLDSDLMSLTRRGSEAAGIAAGEDGPTHVPLEGTRPGLVRRATAQLGSLLWPFDAGARILVGGLLGVLTVLVVETAVTALARDLSSVDAFYTVTKVTTTVGPSSAADTGPAWFKLFSSAAMLLILAFTAVFTAGLVNRLLDRRLTAIVGRSAVPRRDHMVIVGLGQVGLRLCGLLRDLGVPFVAVERNPDAPNVARAKQLRYPVVIGSGGSGRLLWRLSLKRARALAAVTSDEVENISIAVTARRQRDDVNVALRAGDGDATSETRSLFGIGVVRDVYRIAGTAIAAVVLGYDVREAFPYQGTMYLVGEDGEIRPFEPADGESRDEPPSYREPVRDAGG